jgi:hypothetical protein
MRLPILVHPNNVAEDTTAAKKRAKRVKHANQYAYEENSFVFAPQLPVTVNA